MHAVGRVCNSIWAVKQSGQHEAFAYEQRLYTVTDFEFCHALLDNHCQIQ